MFAASIYSARREVLAQRLGSGLVLLLGNRDSAYNYVDNIYPFRQDSTFLYYVGLDLPNLAVVMDLDSGKTTLYGDEPDIDALVWTGPLPAMGERAAGSGIAYTAHFGRLWTDLKGRQAHFLKPYRGETRLDLEALLGFPAAQVHEHASAVLTQAVVVQRGVKAPEEIEEIESALVTTHDIHVLSMREARVGVLEQDVVGKMQGLALSRGYQMAYGVIFSSRGEILHNHDHSVRLRGGELMVNDSGVESLKGYATDITRTFVVGGRFNGLQASMYDLVLKAQEAAIAALKPGIPYRDIHWLACRVMVQGMIDMGFYRGDAQSAVDAGAHALFFQCGTGHMMGLDVHDMEGLGENLVGYGESYERSKLFGHKSLRLARPVREGWVVTVEPGVYINPWLLDQWKAENRHSEFINYAEFEKLRGLGGIRIEDDVLVTGTGSRVLGPYIPKLRSEVEALAR